MTDAPTTEGNGWLQISTTGFAALNQSRPPEHLVKELVQNSLDAVEDTGGTVELTYRHNGSDFVVECRDTGSGIQDLLAMRVVYLTFKTDSHLKRGRFGRGFKEILSVAKTASIHSGNKEIHFVEEEGRQITREAEAVASIVGTRIRMTFSWPPGTVDQFDDYFSRFIVPENVQLILNGRALPHRESAHIIDATLVTEVYNSESHSWQKPRRKTSIELIRARQDEEPYIYEMGIPVASAEWAVLYHANVLQRVPMNPNRDALASGYAKRIHLACLPILLPELDQEEITADWVGSAGAEAAPEIQQKIITKAFGEGAVRSVPTMGKRDFDHDAERTGAVIVKTAQMSSGFREMAKEHLPTSREAVVLAEASAAKSLAEKGFAITDINLADDPRAAWINRQGGAERVEDCLSFAVWFCQKLVDSTRDMLRPVTGKLALGSQPQLFGTELKTFHAHWSGNNVLTLAIDTDCFWREPLGAESLSILIHEAAHARNMHHGKSFVDEVERLGGVAANIMLEFRDEITRQWPELSDYLFKANGVEVVSNVVSVAEPKRSWFRSFRSWSRS
ncbi:MAG: ATP-binding protein [Hyphomicrobiaceae bacterium]